MKSSFNFERKNYRKNIREMVLVLKKEIDTTEKFNFITNEDRIFLVTEYIHSLSSRCVVMCSEKRRVSWQNLNLNILLVLFNGNV